MSESTPVVAKVTDAEAKAKAKQVGALALVRKLGLERAMRAVATARRYADSGKAANTAVVKFDRDEVSLLLQLERVHVSVEDLSTAVKAEVAKALGS